MTNEMNKRLENANHTCCICGKKFIGYGNNPWPIKETEKVVCCDKCNAEYVMPARFAAKFGK